MRGGEVLRPPRLRPPDSLRRQRQARQYSGVDGAGRIGWRACGRSEPRHEVICRARKFWVTSAGIYPLWSAGWHSLVVEAGFFPPSFAVLGVFLMAALVEWGPCPLVVARTITAAVRTCG